MWGWRRWGKKNKQSWPVLGVISPGSSSLLCRNSNFREENPTGIFFLLKCKRRRRRKRRGGCEIEVSGVGGNKRETIKNIYLCSGAIWESGLHFRGNQTWKFFCNNNKRIMRACFFGHYYEQSGAFNEALKHSPNLLSLKLTSSQSSTKWQL